MKRFTETNKWTSNPWFRKLSPKLKCLWMLFCDTCDHAGVFSLDLDMASFQIGEEVKHDDLSIFDGRLVRLKNGKYWIKGFIEFQYGKISRKCAPHNRVFKSIESNDLGEFLHTLSDTLINTLSNTLSNRVEEEEEDKDKKEEKDSLEGVQGEPSTAPEAGIPATTPAPVSPTVHDIVACYPRREAVQAALRYVQQSIRDGADPQAILAGVRGIASAIDRLPSKGLNAYVPSCERFFRDERWRDDPATWLRNGNVQSGSTNGADVGGRRGKPVIHVDTLKRQP